MPHFSSPLGYFSPREEAARRGVFYLKPLIIIIFAIILSPAIISLPSGYELKGRFSEDSYKYDPSEEIRLVSAGLICGTREMELILNKK